MMARSRNIKPDLFKNELLGEADPMLSLVFIGLWCLADRDGKLEDRPKRIKAELFPYRELPLFNGYLTELQRLGFIDRYEVENQPVIKVINFHKHQSPHNTEKASILPENPCPASLTVNSPLNNESITMEIPLIPDSLIPDSLIPDSLIPDSAPKPSSKAKSVKTKINQEMELPDEWKSYALQKWQESGRFDLNAENQFDQFKDYHAANASSMADWYAAWRTWCRNAVQFSKATGYQPKLIQADQSPYVPKLFDPEAALRG